MPLENNQEKKIKIVMSKDIPCILVPDDIFYFNEDYVMKSPLKGEKEGFFSFIQDLKEKSSLKEVLDEIKKRVESE